MTKDHKFPYEWTLKNANFTKDKGKVFSCFSCGGGSTMGYKLAGFDVIGCNEIDKRMMDIYVENHNPKYSFLESIRDFKTRQDLPDELFNLDILDGSPPCSSFSMAGNREKDWGKNKKFAEGQSEQVLDTLFFDFIDLAKRLQPKVVIAENVKGLLLGGAKKYAGKIYKAFNDAGYFCQHWLLNAADMGVPQRRERVFFICLRRDLAEPFLRKKDMFEFAPELNMLFGEPKITYGDIEDKSRDESIVASSGDIEWWEGARKHGDGARVRNGKYRNTSFVYRCWAHLPFLTINTISRYYHYAKCIHVSGFELIKGSSFPCDFNFANRKIQYICGMSVPPVMMAQIAARVHKQWLSKIN